MPMAVACIAARNLAIVDEIDEGNSGKAYQHAQKLKQLVTESTRHINPKYGRQYEEFNSCRWLVFSNSQAALPLEDKDRRFWVVLTADGPKDEGYYRALYALLDDELFITSVAHMLGQRNIADFNPGQRPPLTTFEVTLDRNAKATACKIIVSSGHSELDDTTCRLVIERGRFELARGQANSGEGSR